MRSNSDCALVGLGLGGNLGDPRRQIAEALALIAAREIGTIARVSSLWRTPPWGVTDQPAFLNACALIETRLAPYALLTALKAIERDVGRTPGVRWGPRSIDLDILFYDDVALEDATLTVPHKNLFERAFVLAPLAEIAGERMIAGRRVEDALAAVDTAGLERISTPEWLRHTRGPDMMGERIELHCADGATISAWLARPQGTPKGGMVVLQEIFGVNHHIRAVAECYAQEGYLAVAPALFDRVEKDVELGYDGTDMTRGVETRARTKLDDALTDIAAAIAEASKGGKVGAVGYCWGGSLAWAAATRLSGLSAAVGYYGGLIVGMVGETPRVPTMLHFGAKDKHIPLSDVEMIRDAHPAVPVYVYDADHGFNCDERASFDAAAAEVARERTLAFFDEHLSSR